MEGQWTGNIMVGCSSGGPTRFDLKYANRHGLITGATGTGKTVTLQVLAEGFSAAGVPVFAPDVKGDLAGISQLGEDTPAVRKRATDTGFASWSPAKFPVELWDVFQRTGFGIRATVESMGPELLARMLELTPVQAGGLNVVLMFAAGGGLQMRSLADLQVVLRCCAMNTGRLSSRYGYVAPSTIGIIQRQLSMIEAQGGSSMLCEPMLDIEKLMRVDDAGRGIVNILSAEELMDRPQLYAVLMMWLLRRLRAVLPEVGDIAQPKLVFFFDEAHLLFRNATRGLLEEMERTVRLIRSKGVGVYFVTQSPSDIPDTILAQLGNRFHHAMRAYTPRDQRAVKVAADTMRPKPGMDAYREMMSMGKGEALVSLLEDEGVPGVAEKVTIRPPVSRIGPITLDERKAIIMLRPVMSSPVDVPWAWAWPKYGRVTWLAVGWAALLLVWIMLWG